MSHSGKIIGIMKISTDFYLCGVNLQNFFYNIVSKWLAMILALAIARSFAREAKNKSRSFA